MRALFLGLGLTLAVELGFSLCVGVRGRMLGVVALANVMTNPLVAALAGLWRAYALPGYAAAVALLELSAVLAEGAVYARRELSHPFRFSLAANVLSFGLGQLLRAFF